MQFVVEHHEVGDMLGGAIVTFVACETCGKKIDRHAPGIVVFRDGEPGEDGHRRASAIHKGACDTAATRELPWQDLDIFLRDIVMNAGIDLAVTEARINEPGGLREMGLHR
jgi:hypothetical protein